MKTAQKTFGRKPLALIIALGWLAQLPAQTFTTLYAFTNGNDGAGPQAGLVWSGNMLYGTAAFGGNAGFGTVFALTFPPAPIPLNVQLVDNAVVLSSTDPSFVLQAAPEVTGVFTNIPGATSPHTNTFTDPQMFFRLHGQ